jgi:hypothetical protein
MRLYLFALAACASSTPQPHPIAPAPSADIALALPGPANALHWDDATSTLYLVNEKANTLVAWTEHGGLKEVAALPARPAGVALGDIVMRPDHSLVVASFGFGTEGTVIAVAGDKATAVTGLEPTRRRIGLAIDPSGNLYSAYFVAAGKGVPPEGGVSVISLDGSSATEREIAGPSTNAGFKKIVGVAAARDSIYVSDQALKTIFKLGVPGYTLSPVATVPAADLLMLLPGGDLVTGGGPTVTRVSPSGTVSTIAGPHFTDVRGLAYDAAHHRLFVLDHDKDHHADTVHTLAVEP